MEHPPIDKAWPIDIRRWRGALIDMEVLLDGVRQNAVVAASPETGHLLVFQGEPKGLGFLRARRTQPCACPTGMHELVGEFCYPYELKAGKVEIRTRA